jgi:hypothetical protein
MSKMDMFNKGAALILARLYEEFPTPIHLNVAELSDGITEEEGGVYAATLSFLRDEGFVRSGNSVNRGLMTSNVVLTSKGLDILNSTPEVLQVRAPLGERVKDVAKSGSKEVLSAVIQAVIGAVVAKGI